MGGAELRDRGAAARTEATGATVGREVDLVGDKAGAARSAPRRKTDRRPLHDEPVRPVVGSSRPHERRLRPTEPSAAGSGGSGLAPGLYVVATPIGNLGDLGERAKATLAAADAVVCEDSRVTGLLLHRLGIERPLLVYNDHSAPRLRPKLLRRLAEGAALALVSDAGTPTISDPGYRLVRAALDAGITVRAVPGPCAPIAALSIAGLPTDRFLFAGFLPPRSAARKRELEELRPVRATLVLLESGPRLAALLRDAAEILGEREAVVARELTKLHEELRRGRLAQLAAMFGAEPPPRGELVVLIGPPEAKAPELAQEKVDAALREAAAHLPPGRAARRVAAATGRPAAELYRRLRELGHDGNQGEP
jgi:16S rRNA (cytidine1402-2'-O)-methyltransferase